jgi:hypothetical protein
MERTALCNLNSVTDLKDEDTWYDQNDDGETEINLGFIGLGFNDQILQCL